MLACIFHKRQQTVIFQYPCTNRIDHRYFAGPHHLEQAGELDQELLRAAEATAALMDQWRAQGATETEAWEIARNEFLFPGPEQEVLDAEEADLQAERDERYPRSLLQAMSRNLPED